MSLELSHLGALVQAHYFDFRLRLMQVPTQLNLLLQHPLLCCFCL